MQIMMIKAQMNPVMIEVEHCLHSFQQLVGGMIEVVEPFLDNDVVLVCDENGRDKGKPVNRIINTNIDICGDFFFCGQIDDQLCDFPKNKELYYKAMFQLQKDYQYV